jgi:phage tail sheath protein FI
MVIDLAPWASRIRRWLGRQPPVGAEIETRTGAVLDSLAGVPNGEALWETVRRRVEGEVLLPLWRAGRLQGTTAEEAWFVRCDRTTMTQDDLHNGRLVVLVGFAAVKPAEFELLRVVRAT